MRMPLTDPMRPTSFGMEQFRRAIEERGARLARSGIRRGAVEGRPWQEPDRGATQQSTDNYPVYKETVITDNVIGLMKL